jgi:hypothetical protein
MRLFDPDDEAQTLPPPRHLRRHPKAGGEAQLSSSAGNRYESTRWRPVTGRQVQAPLLPRLWVVLARGEHGHHFAREAAQTAPTPFAATGPAAVQQQIAGAGLAQNLDLPRDFIRRAVDRAVQVDLVGKGAPIPEVPGADSASFFSQALRTMPRRVHCSAVNPQPRLTPSNLSRRRT